MAMTARGYVVESSGRHDTSSTEDRSEVSHSPAPELNPTKIAQDFILQYYSVRSRYPESLYRFYREDSTLTMGCHQGEHVVTGKTAIADYLASIGYHNCINSVAAFNAQIVLPTCIAILISGEMSNNDETLRRYSEMFTLIRYDVDRFYVKSHMFHFQDDAFSDNSACSGSVCEQPTVPAVTNSESTGAVDLLRKENCYLPAEPSVPSYVVDSIQTNSNQVESVPYESNLPTTLADTPTNGFEDEPMTESNPIPVVNHESTPEQERQVNDYVGRQFDAVETTSQPWEEIGSPEHGNGNDGFNSHQTVNNGPPESKTWAGIAGSGSTVHAHLPRQAYQGRRSAAPSSHAYENGGRKSRPPIQFSATEENTNESAAVTAPHEPNIRSNQGRPRGANGNFRPNSYNNFPGPRKSMPPGEVKQFFVGNLPHDCEEQELRAFFEKFGVVQQLRINQSKENLPYYGFVVMESSESAEKILQTKPLLIRDGSHRINAERRNHENGNRHGPARDFKKNNFSGDHLAR